MQNTVHSISLDIIDVQYMDMSSTYFNKNATRLLSACDVCIGCHNHLCCLRYNLLPTTSVRHINGFITGFHIYKSTFSVTYFPLSKKAFVEHLLFIGQQYNEVNNLFNINCHTRLRNGSRLFFAHFRFPVLKSIK